MSDPRHVLGLSIEEAVADWLAGAGWRIVARRARAPGGGEVDLVAIDPQRVLVGIEVRARRHERTGTAADSVDHRHLARMRRTLASIAPTTAPHAGLRIDLVTAEPVAGDQARWWLRRFAAIDTA